jgi:hypothetical protein
VRDFEQARRGLHAVLTQNDDDPTAAATNTAMATATADAVTMEEARATADAENKAAAAAAVRETKAVAAAHAASAEAAPLTAEANENASAEAQPKTNGAAAGGGHATAAAAGGEDVVASGGEQEEGVTTSADVQLATNTAGDNPVEKPTAGGASTAAYYTALGVTTDADVDTIRKAYHKLAIRHHPDKGGDSEQFKAITTAFECLSDISERALCDRGGQVAAGQSAGNEADGDAPAPAAAPAPERSVRQRAPPDRMDPAEERARPQLLARKQNSAQGTVKAEAARTATAAREVTTPTSEAAEARALTRAQSRQAADGTSRGTTRASSTSTDTALHNEALGSAQQLPARVDSRGAPVLEFLLRGGNLVYVAPDPTAATRGRMPKGPHRVLETRESTADETWLHVAEGGWIRVRIDTAAPAVRRAPARRTAALPSTPSARTKSSRKAAKTPPQAPPKKKITQRMTSAGEHGGEGGEGQ